LSIVCSPDGATLFSTVDLNKLRGYVKDKIELVCAKFGAKLIDTFKFTSRKTNLWPTLYNVIELNEFFARILTFLSFARL